MSNTTPWFRFKQWFKAEDRPRIERYLRRTLVIFIFSLLVLTAFTMIPNPSATERSERTLAWYMCELFVKQRLGEAYDVQFARQFISRDGPPGVRKLGQFHYEVVAHVTWSDWRGDRLRTYFDCQVKRANARAQFQLVSLGTDRLR